MSAQHRNLRLQIAAEGAVGGGVAGPIAPDTLTLVPPLPRSGDISPGSSPYALESAHDGNQTMTFISLRNATHHRPKPVCRPC
eukprot:6088163-Pyramimonas_sp.AAC.1